MEENQSVHEQEVKAEKQKRPEKFHLMLFVDGKQGAIKQMGISQRAMEVIFLIGIAVFGVLVAGWIISGQIASKATLEKAVSEETVRVLNEKVSELELQNAELNNKITVLSDTLNAKVEKENEMQKEEVKAHTPNGFPLSASATMETKDDNPNMLLFKASKDTNVLATGAGSVAEIATAAEYEVKLTIDHGNGYKTVYYNNGNPMVKEGDQVIAGSALFVVGEGNEEVGYQIFLEDEELNPIDLLEIDG